MTQTQPTPIATIKVHNLRLRTLVGFNPEEREKKQDVVINIEISYKLDDGVIQDHVESALNYKTITKQVIQYVDDGEFLLLEKLVVDVLNICSRHPAVEHANVTIEKPHALRFADSVSVSLDYAAEHSEPCNLLEKAS